MQIVIHVAIKNGGNDICLPRGVLNAVRLFVYSQNRLFDDSRSLKTDRQTEKWQFLLPVRLFVGTKSRLRLWDEQRIALFGDNAVRLFDEQNNSLTRAGNLHFLIM